MTPETQYEPVDVLANPETLKHLGLTRLAYVPRKPYELNQLVDPNNALLAILTGGVQKPTLAQLHVLQSPALADLLGSANVLLDGEDQIMKQLDLELGLINGTYPERDPAICEKIEKYIKALKGDLNHTLSGKHDDRIGREIESRMLGATLSMPEVLPKIQARMGVLVLPEELPTDPTDLASLRGLVSMLVLSVAGLRFPLKIES